jgi:signal transduction histidine kinase
MTDPGAPLSLIYVVLWGFNLTPLRERVALRIELEQTRERLAVHLRDVGRILDSEEDERRSIALQLHEGAAQDIAALLLKLQVLARDLDRELGRKQLDDVRSIARDTLAGIRQIALSLRPPSLEHIGLRAAHCRG